MEIFEELLFEFEQAQAAVINAYGEPEECLDLEMQIIEYRDRFTFAFSEYNNSPSKK